LKTARRRCEHHWRANPSLVTLNLLHEASNFYTKSVLAAKRLYYSELVRSVSNQPRELWHTVNNILHRNQPPFLPSSVPSSSIAQLLGSFFSDKIIKLRSTIASSTNSSPHQQCPPVPPPSLKSFRPATVGEICNLISHLPDKQCELDPIPTSVLKKCLPVLAKSITDIVNLSLSTGSFPHSFKQSVVTPLLKKPSLDKENSSNYRPISNLSFLSKLVERIVKTRLDIHLASNSLYNPFQSAYTRYHSTETNLLAVHDSLIQAIAHQKVTCLCLLELSAAFDTIDHNILIHRLSSWFGITDAALSWFESYLADRHFIVSASGHKSSTFLLSCGVPQGSVLGPILFIMYTTPFSSLLSNTGINHHLYADDTQLFISFSPSSYPTNIIQLQSVIAQVSTWMSANLLILNPSKTEFLVIGNPQQLAKLNNPQLTLDCNTTIVPVQKARNLGVIFDNHLSLNSQITALSQSCFYHIRDLRRIRDSLDFKTASTIATALVHSKLDYCNSLYYNLPAYEIHRLQYIQNSLARAVCRTSKFAHISPTLKALHWLKITERIEYKVASLTYNALQFHQPSYISDLLTVQSNSHNTRSSSLVTLKRPTVVRAAISKRSFYHSAPVLWNSLPPCLRQPAENSSNILGVSRPYFLAHLKTFLFSKSFPP